MNVEYRRLKMQDFEQAKKLVYLLDCQHADHEPDVFQNPGDSRLSFEDFKHRVSLTHMHAQGAFIEERLVGMILVKSIEKAGKGPVRARKIAVIEEVIIDPDYSRLGIGKHLMKLGFSWAKQQMVNDIELIVWEGNQVAIKFYDDLGFRTLHRRLIRKL